MYRFYMLGNELDGFSRMVNIKVVVQKIWEFFLITSTSATLTSTHLLSLSTIEKLVRNLSILDMWLVPLPSYGKKSRAKE